MGVVRSPLRRRKRPLIPWMWDHVHATRDALEAHIGAGRHLTCYDPRTNQPCWLTDAWHTQRGYESTVANALAAIRERRHRFTWAQLDACILALDHATRHPPPGEGSRSPWPYSEALEILTAWMRDYDRRLP